MYNCCHYLLGNMSDHQGNWQQHICPLKNIKYVKIMILAIIWKDSFTWLSKGPSCTSGGVLKKGLA